MVDYLIYNIFTYLTMYCKCGTQIPAKRAELLQKWGKPITCVECSREEPVGGFMATVGKTERTLIVTDQQTAEQLHNLSARAGTGVSRGVKMQQSFDVTKYNK